MSPARGEPLLSVAIPKGRLLGEASGLFEEALGVSPKRLLENTRRLAADAPEHGLRFISIRAADVAAFARDLHLVRGVQINLILEDLGDDDLGGPSFRIKITIGG